MIGTTRQLFGVFATSSRRTKVPHIPHSLATERPGNVGPSQLSFFPHFLAAKIWRLLSEALKLLLCDASSREKVDFFVKEGGRYNTRKCIPWRARAWVQVVYVGLTATRAQGCPQNHCPKKVFFWLIFFCCSFDSNNCLFLKPRTPSIDLNRAIDVLVNS